MAAFDYNTAPGTHAIFNDGIYFPRVDYLGNNIWVRVRHIDDDPNGTGVGYNVTKTASSPFRLGGFGGWWGFKYQVDIYKDINSSGVPGYMLDGLSPTNITVESIETLSAAEWVTLQILNSEGSYWWLNSINFTGNNPGSNPGFSATNLTYSSPGYTSNFPAISKTINAIDNGGSNYAEFRTSAENVSQLNYGYEYPNSGGYQGIRLYVGNPPLVRPANDACADAVTLTPVANYLFSGTAGTLTNAQASNFTDCDHIPTFDVWYKFTATAPYHRIIIKNATIADSVRFQLYSGDCSGLHSMTCVLNSHDSTMYDAIELVPGNVYYIKVYTRKLVLDANSFVIGINTPPITIDKNSNLLTNRSFETPVQPTINNNHNVGNTFNGWVNRSGGNMGIVRAIIGGPGSLLFGADSASHGEQYLDMLGFNDSLYNSFTIASPSTIFFNGHFANQAAQYYSNTYVSYTAFCGIMDENNVMVAKSNVMNFTNKLTDKAWYQLSGTVFNLPAGNYHYVGYVSNYSNFDDAFLQAVNSGCIVQSSAPTSVTTDDVDNIICTGSNITLTANGGTPANAAIYTWYENGVGSGGTLVGTGQSITLTPIAGVHNYFAVLAEECGNTGYARVTITVAPVPVVTISSNMSGNICAGTNVTFTAAVSNGGIGDVYQWKLNDVNVGTNSAYYSNAALQHNDVVKCVVSNNGCSTSSSLTISVNQAPTSVNISTLFNPTATICAGPYGYITFVATATGMGTTLNDRFFWKKNGVPVANEYWFNPYYLAYNLSNNDTITCEMHSSVSCTLPTTSNAITITVNPIINTAVSIAITAGTNPDCDALPLTFTATPVNPGSTPLYQWKINGVDIAGANSDTYTINTPANNDIVTCSMQSSLPCTNPSIATSNTIIVKAPTVLYAAIGYNTLSTCAGGSLNFSAYIYSGGGTDPVYQWNLKRNNVITNVGTGVGYTQTGFVDGDEITLTVTSNEPCISPVTFTTDPLIISVYDVSTASLSLYDPGSICSGANGTFLALAINAGSHPHYEWLKNGNIVGGDYDYYQDNTLVTGDIITCSIMTDAECGTPIHVLSNNDITVTITDPVTATISISASNPVFSSANTFTATFTNAGPDGYYSWRKNGLNVGVDHDNQPYLDIALVNGDVITCILYSNAPCVISAYTTSNSIIVQPLVYCTPGSIFNVPACNNGWIANVQLGTSVNRTSGCNGFYADFSATDILTAAADEVISYSITGGTDGPDWVADRKIYIDYNNDGGFNDANELVAQDLNSSAFQVSTGNFRIPQLIAPGTYRIRVISDQQINSACELYYGEAEDYTLLIPQPVYCIPVITQPCDMWIANTTIGSINNTTTQPAVCTAGGYTDYTNLFSTTAAPGQTVDFTLTGGSNIYYQQWQYADIYIDFNNDGDFDDAGENVVSNFSFYAGYPYSGSFTIPVGQPYGYYRMRVKSYEYNEPQTGPCGNNTNGEAEDYTLLVQLNTSITVNLKLFLQGYYTGSGTMQPVLNNQSVINSLPNETDTVTVQLHHPETFALIDSKQAVLLTDGTVSVNFEKPEGPYYIAVLHRNSVQTWTADPLLCSASTALYNFTIAANKAMGDNMIETEPGIWAFFTGDMNQDDFIDGNDFPEYDFESASSGLYDGVYTGADMNGDGFVDGNDFPIFDGNSSNAVSAVHP